MSILRTNKLTKVFDGLEVISELSIDLNKNEIIGLVGPRGAGKTTAFNTITGVYKPTSGRIYFDGVEITGMKTHEITKLGILRTYEKIHLFKELTVLENLLIANHLHLKSNIFKAIIKTPNYRKEEKYMYEKSIKLLKKFGLENLIYKKTSKLTYLQKRKIEVVRGLASNPKVLLLDEPTVYMNKEESIDTINFINKIKEDFNVSIIIAESNIKPILKICEKIYVMNNGVVVGKKNLKEIKKNSNPLNYKDVIKEYIDI